MIDEKAFKDTWVLLCDRFNRAPSTPLMLAYYETLSPKMTTAQFKAAAQRIFEVREFFPRPADFLETVAPDDNAAALEQWEHVWDLMRGFGDKSKLTEESKRVIRLLGGETKLRNTDLDAVQFVRRDFMQLYGEAVEIARREEGERVEPGPLANRITAAAMEGSEALARVRDELRGNGNVVRLPAPR